MGVKTAHTPTGDDPHGRIPPRADTPTGADRRHRRGAVTIIPALLRPFWISGASVTRLCHYVSLVNTFDAKIPDTKFDYIYI